VLVGVVVDGLQLFEDVVAFVAVVGVEQHRQVLDIADQSLQTNTLYPLRIFLLRSHLKSLPVDALDHVWCGIAQVQHPI
jgi:hypothetical protein